MGAQKQHGKRVYQTLRCHLVWYEVHEGMESAIEREKQLKEWKRKWKLELIESIHPCWEDLYQTII
jgi:putative endonuclease